MKPATVLLTVILFVTVIIFTAGFFITKKKTAPVIADSNVLPGTSLKEEKAAPAPQPAYKQEAPPKAATSKLVKPYFNKMVKGDSVPYCGVMPMAEDITDNIITCKLATEAEYPGGAAAWARFLQKNMCYPGDAIEVGTHSVLVKFMVDKEGNVSDVEAVNGAGALAAEAVRVIKKSGRWTPAKQISDGRYVNSLKTQPFIICIEEE